MLFFALPTMSAPIWTRNLGSAMNINLADRDFKASGSPIANYHLLSPRDDWKNPCPVPDCPEKSWGTIPRRAVLRI